MDRKCYYAHDKVAGKVWIPGCMCALYGPPCVCRQREKELGKLYPSEATKDKLHIRELEKENAQLWRIIKKINKRGLGISITPTGLRINQSKPTKNAEHQRNQH